MNPIIPNDPRRLPTAFLSSEAAARPPVSLHAAEAHVAGGGVHGLRGIRVNAVALGTIATGRLQALLAEGGPSAARAGEQVRLLHPLGRPGRPGEAADAVRYLLADEASFVNGSVLAVDGGRSALGLDPEQAP